MSLNENYPQFCELLGIADDRRDSDPCPDNCPGCNAPGGVGECGSDDRRENLREFQAREAEQNIRAREADEEITRLRAELAEVKGDLTAVNRDTPETIARLRTDLEMAQLGNKQLQRSNEAYKNVNARLRAELDTANRRLNTVREQDNAAEATIERVRAVLDGLPDYAEQYVDLARAALEGDSE